MGWVNEATQGKIAELIPQLSMKFGRMQSIGPCPSCKTATRGDADRRGPIGLTANGRGWKCWSCGVAGDVVDLASFVFYDRRMRDLSEDERTELRNKFTQWGILSGGANGFRNPMKSVDDLIKKGAKPRQRTDSSGFEWKRDLDKSCAADLWAERGAEVLAYLVNVRGFTPETIRSWGLGSFSVEYGDLKERWVSIPLKDETGKTVNIRFRRVRCKRCKDTGEVSKSYRVCRGRPLPLFGSDRLTRDKSTEVAITEGEFDVIALHQYGLTTNVVSGTAGAAANWPDEWLDILEPYSSFVIVYDDDAAGVAGADKLAEKLGKYRCSRAMLPCNDAAECIQSQIGEDEVLLALQQSNPMLGTRLCSVDEYRDDIEKLISSPEELIGRPTGSNKLDRVIGGLRPGLWVLTGETGHGKTTLATWLVREQALHGIGGMLTSFEQRPIGTVQKLLRAHIGGDFTQVTPEQRAQALGELGQLPIWIMDHYGEATDEQVLDTIRFARRRYDVRIALIDHLGFLTRGAGDRERQKIEEIVRSLALIAVNDQMTILLVCHPNRTFASQQRRVRISDLKGASAIEQDSHVGIVVERQVPSPTRTFPAAKVYIDKVRSEFGSPGAHILLPFDPLACVYADKWEDTPSGAAGLNPLVPG